MVKKKKKELDYCESCGEDLEECVCVHEEEKVFTEDESLDPEHDAETYIDQDTEEMPANPMGLAYQLSKESEVIKHFKELPREVKYSFYDSNDKIEVKHFARTLRDWQYIEKIIELRTNEDSNKFNSRDAILKIKSKEDLKQYLRDTNRQYLINDIDDLEQEAFESLIKHFQIMKANEFMNTIESTKTEINTIYSDYKEEKDLPDYIDDAGNMGKIMDTSLTSMGYKGNAAQHSVMTINAVKNEDIQKAAEEKTKFSFLDAVKRRFG